MKTLKITAFGLFVSFFGLQEAKAQSNPNKAYADNQIEVEPGVFAIFSGDIDQNGSVDALDFLLLDPDIQNGEGGYLLTDLDGSGGVDAIVFLVLDPNIQNGIGVAIP
jgi:hypothetical protein